MFYIPRLAIFIPRLAIFIPSLGIYLLSRYKILLPHGKCLFSSRKTPKKFAQLSQNLYLYKLKKQAPQRKP